VLQAQLVQVLQAQLVQVLQAQLVRQAQLESKAFKVKLDRLVLQDRKEI
jgi:hypothetical protein